ncbi:HTH-type transcriptional regulator SgrR [Chromobacterium amazonense]|uniref:HTH-type transcriptional regulator SgrR n=1 Tax=Chromobacterium amazonense TaxID=1382803 RepID=A0ABU8UWD4_9NEIS|nr:HTH-type transcriptional regulator SgrR [Chromobacterium amazonense]MDQ4542536.1 HTH-type transcriptional regulator SgrR [Chromobacterium amazonense]
MSHNRLLQQYSRLHRGLQGQACAVSLQQLADLLCCTRRHMRSLLAQMQALGWVEWSARSGRGQRSALRFLRDIGQLQRQQASHLLEQGKVEQAVALLGDDPQQLAPVLLSRLGRRWSEDRQVLGVPYYRPMPNLHPGTPLRRSERHLVSQIFNGLTRLNEEKGEIEGDLAHHWEPYSDLEWHFHLRPRVRWHDGRELRQDDIAASVARLRALPLFAHLRGVRRLSPQSIALELSEPDPWLPWLLADPAALILPADHAALPDFASRPVGTGPYRVAVNDAHRLSLQAFDDYFGFRALLDQVDIWMMPQLGDQLSLKVQETCDLTVEINPLPVEEQTEMALETGVYYLLCDGRSPAMRDDAVRRWLAQALSPLAIMQQTPPSTRQYWVAASGLLPRWHHVQPAPIPPAPPLTRLRLAYYEQHPEYRQIADAIARGLAEHGIALECTVHRYSDWELGLAETDLWLGTVNFSSGTDYAVPAWLLGTPLLRRCLEPMLPLTDSLRGWRGGEHSAASLSAQTVRQHWILPLFHNWLRLKGPGQIEDFRLNSMGWFDFKSVWLRPEED